jgi:hypothetical protein
MKKRYRGALSLEAPQYPGSGGRTLTDVTQSGHYAPTELGERLLSG